MAQPPSSAVRTTIGKKRKAPADEDLEQTVLDDKELRQALKDVGVDAGPIDSSSREIYMRLYNQKKRKLEAGESLIDGPKTTSTTTAPTRKNAGKAADPTTKQRKATRAGGKEATEQAIKNFQLEGLIAAVYTPFKDNKTKDVNLSVIESYAKHLHSTGVKGVFVNGTTGEGLSLTTEERKQVAEHWVKVSAGRLKVIVHVGTENLKSTCELAKQAADIGASGIGVMPTTFFKPGSIEVLVQYLSEVAEKAPGLPMYYYHIPAMTGVSFSMEEFLDVASTRLPTLRGVKYTDHNLFEYGRCVTAHEGKYQIVYGCDEQLIGALSLGGIAAIGSTYNFAGRLYSRLMQAYASKDTETAKLEQRRSQAMIRVYFNHGSHSKGLGKAILKMCGVDCGPYRLPNTSLPESQSKKLKEDLEDIAFFFWC